MSGAMPAAGAPAGASPSVSVTEHWCLGLDAGPAEGLCLHCETCAHVWRGQPGAIVHPPGRVVLLPDGTAPLVRIVECGLRRAVEPHAVSVARLPRQVRDQDATRVTGGFAAGQDLGGLAM